MAPARKLRTQEYVHQPLSLIGIVILRAQRQHIGVVVLPRQAYFVLIPGQGGADTWHLIRGDRHANTGRADKNTALRLALADILRHARGVVGLVGRIRIARSVVDNFMSGRGKVRPQFLFQLETGVVGANCDFHVPLNIYGSESRRL